MKSAVTSGDPKVVELASARRDGLSPAWQLQLQEPCFGGEIARDFPRKGLLFEKEGDT